MSRQVGARSSRQVQATAQCECKADRATFVTSSRHVTGPCSNALLAVAATAVQGVESHPMRCPALTAAPPSSRLREP